MVETDMDGSCQKLGKCLSNNVKKNKFAKKKMNWHFWKNEKVTRSVSNFVWHIFEMFEKNELEINIVMVRKLNYLKNDAELDV